ncbi:MAG TPA: phosphatidylserine/phosphatidylglycerophosphate/cardiolipin synthase family protein, partial [Candidatus Xenobia bacterium]
LQKTYPNAHVFALGNDQGDDAQAFAGLGSHAYVRCDDATQRRVPAGFTGVVADDYTQELQARMLGDMGTHENVPDMDALQPVPIIAHENLVEKVKGLVPLLKGTPGETKAKAAAHLQRQGAGLAEMARLGEVGPQAASNGQLAATAEKLLRPSPGQAADAGAAFLRAITAHGDDAGHVDTILQRIPNVDRKVKVFDVWTQTAYAALRAKNQAVPGDWDAFDRYVDAATDTQRVPGTVEPLINGQHAFPRMLADIDKAQTSISMTMFSLQSDEAGWEFAKHLAAASDPKYAAELAKTDPTFAARSAQNRHVAVRILYDDFGSSLSNGQRTDPRVYQFLRDHGVEIAAHPPGPLGNHLDHRKIMVLDGTTGYIGGMNVGNEYRDLWHDVHSRVTGPVVNDLQRLCNEQFKEFVGPIPPSEEAAMFPRLAAPPNAKPTRVIGHIGHRDRNLKMTYLRAIQTATQRICIADPYFSDPDIVDALAAAAKRGVQVDIVVPKYNNHKLEGAASRHDYDKLQAAGARVHEYYGRVMAHDKVAIFDNHLATIGSSNLDMRSDWDDEANVWVEDPAVVDDLYKNLFQKDFTKSEDMAGYKPRVGVRLYNEVGSLLRSQF